MLTRQIWWHRNKKYLWEHAFLSSDNAELLHDTLLWVLGVQFALRAGQEHRNLRPRNSLTVVFTVWWIGAWILAVYEDIRIMGDWSICVSKRKFFGHIKIWQMLSDARLSCIKNTCLACQMKSATTHFICALCQSQMGKYCVTKGQQGENFRKCGKENYEKSAVRWALH